MTYAEMEKRALELQREQVETKFYEMVLCFSFETNPNIKIEERQYNNLVSIMTDYLNNHTSVSSWDVAGTIVYLVQDNGVEALIDDWNNFGTMLEDELCKSY